MNTQTTYSLLVRSEEKSRDLLEAAVYAMCILSAIVAIWQFVEQSSRLSVDGLALRMQPAHIVSHHAAEWRLDAEFEGERVDRLPTTTGLPRRIRPAAD